MLFFISYTIKSYRGRQTDFTILDNPELTLYGHPYPRLQAEAPKMKNPNRKRNKSFDKFGLLMA